MRLSSLLTSLVYATALVAARNSRCGSQLSTDETVVAEGHFQANKVSVARFTEGSDDKYNIDVHFHVINTGDSLAEGNLDDSHIEAQIAVLNEDYASTGFSFTLVNITRTLNADWFDNAVFRNSYDAEMKRALRTGGPETLNIFTVGFTTRHPLFTGYSSYASMMRTEPEIDGLVVRYNTLPGVGVPPYNMGRSATHTLGHWFGLYHTAQNACGPLGDFVDDTPLEASEALGCPTGRDTCPDDPGLDPIHNFMDSTDDDCMREFTPGQAQRMREQVATYRGIVF
ncbi:metalloprotease [Coprinopsis cinerea AmutBmut pab1-1]|nr:metalloprotease [Coprinopsis cinerea AmutBmut pab1-1]